MRKHKANSTLSSKLIRLISQILAGVTSLIVPLFLVNTFGKAFYNSFDFVLVVATSTYSFVDSGSSNMFLTSSYGFKEFARWFLVVVGLSTVVLILLLWFKGHSVYFSILGILFILKFSINALTKFADGKKNTKVDARILVYRGCYLFLYILLLGFLDLQSNTYIILIELLSLFVAFFILVKLQSTTVSSELESANFVQKLIGYSRPLYLFNMFTLLILFWERSLLIDNESSYSAYSFGIRIITAMGLITALFSQYITRDLRRDRRKSTPMINLMFYSIIISLTMFILFSSRIYDMIEISELRVSMSILLFYPMLHSFSALLLMYLLSMERTVMYSRISLASVILSFTFILLFLTSDSIININNGFEWRFVVVQLLVMFIMLLFKDMRSLVKIITGNKLLFSLLCMTFLLVTLNFFESEAVPYLSLLILFVCTINYKTIFYEIKNSFS